MPVNPVRNIKDSSPKNKISNGVKVIIFDLGNVILKFDMHLVSGEIAKRFSLDEARVYEFFFDSPLTGIHDEGKIDAREFHRQAMAAHNIDMDFNEFRKIWNRIFTENTEVTSLIPALSRKYRIFLMSNTNRMHFDYIKKQFGIIKRFDRIFTSYEVGERKPHPRIYEEAIKAAGAEPSDIVFIDDREELAEGARRLGIRAIQFKNITQLKEDLIKNGIELTNL